MDDKIFVLNQTGRLTELRESKYDSEYLLQKLLSDYSELLAGSQIDEVNPRNWIFISREMGVPDKENSGNRWSLDHLFIDQDAIPTLVEVKRSTDTRIRREVIGQILDYAANAVAYWSIDQLISEFDSNCKSNNLDPNEQIDILIDNESTIDEFWEQVSTNLKAGKIRLLIVADKIPYELKSIIEFLNAQMSPAEILGLEIKQFKNDNLKTLVPKVIGKTTKSDSIKKSRRVISKSINLDEFYEVFAKHSGKNNMKLAREIINELESFKDYYYFGGSGIEHGIGHSILPTTYAKFNNKRKKIYPFSIWTSGVIEVHLQYLKGRGDFGNEDKQKIIIDKLNEIEGVNINYDKVFKKPNLSIALLENTINKSKFISLLKWIYEELEKQNEL